MKNNLFLASVTVFVDAPYPKLEMRIIKADNLDEAYRKVTEHYEWAKSVEIEYLKPIIQ